MWAALGNLAERVGLAPSHPAATAEGGEESGADDLHPTAAVVSAPAARRSRRLALKRITIGDLPETALRRILLAGTTHDNLLRFVAACARVCAEWRRVVGGSAAYGLGLPRGQREDEDVV